MIFRNVCCLFQGRVPSHIPIFTFSSLAAVVSISVKRKRPAATAPPRSSKITKETRLTGEGAVVEVNNQKKKGMCETQSSGMFIYRFQKLWVWITKFDWKTLSNLSFKHIKNEFINHPLHHEFALFRKVCFLEPSLEDGLSWGALFTHEDETLALWASAGDPTNENLRP